MNQYVFGVFREIYKHLQSLLPAHETIHMGGDEVSDMTICNRNALFFNCPFCTRFSWAAGIRPMKLSIICATMVWEEKLLISYNYGPNFM